MIDPSQLHPTIPDIGGILSPEIEAVSIRYPDGRPTGWKITVAGPAHATTMAAEADGTMNHLDRLKARILGWSLVQIDGHPFPFTPENVAALVTWPALEPAFAQLVDHVAGCGL